MSLLRRHLSRLTRLILVAALFLVVGIATQVWPVIRKNAADQSEHAQPARLDAAAGTSRPTKEQWAGFKIEPVRLVTFRPEQVTEGNIAIDDDDAGVLTLFRAGPRADRQTRRSCRARRTAVRDPGERVCAGAERPDRALKPGMFANFSIITGEEEAAPAVPRSTLVHEGTTARVWVAGDDGTITARSVRAGRIAAGMVPQGAKIVTSPVPVIDRAIGNG